ncbi:MAG: CIA30 family protein [Spirochaetia bacterium]
MKKTWIILIFLLVFTQAFFISSEEFTNADKWFSYNDKANGGNSQIKLTTGNETIGGKSYFVVTATGKVTTTYEYGFVGFGYKPEGAEMDALKAAKGIKFKAIGDGKSYRFRGETTVISDSDYHGKVFSTKKGRVVEVSIPFISLRQEGWGTARGGFNANKLWQISFQTVGQPLSSVSLKLFDFQLIK